ncbi:response regulator [Neorhizobium lilium]|uniref:Response regulator n=1 Tax=Neorhizobium lilium TaxID=2503024 RepID=A0A3S3REX7_9HYPH|nr:response regulator [Neorhizobium lilium]RWX75910.1 response regulator [Neorhizobium lilium]
MIPTVLLVEDDQLLMLDAEEALAAEGFEVVSVGNGAQALAKLDEDAERFDAVVTDIRLGDGPSGWDIGHRARELVLTMPVIYMTADSAKAWASQGVPNSVLIQKPFVPAQLITAVTTLLNQNAIDKLS